MFVFTGDGDGNLSDSEEEVKEEIMKVRENKVCE